MDTTTVLDTLNTIDYGLLSLSIFSVAVILLGFYFIRKSGYFGIEQIVNLKRQKEEAINVLITALEATKEINGKLISQKEVIESFDTDTVKLAIDKISEVTSNTTRFICLNNQSLVNDAVYYFSGQKKMLEELKIVEQDSYNFQVDYQQRVLFYNREFDKLKNQNIDQDTIIEYKKDILDELERIRVNVSSALDNLNIKRNEFYTELKLSQTLADNLLTKLYNFKNKQIKTKKFYLRYLAFL